MKKLKILAITTLLILIVSISLAGRSNPAKAYCEELRHEYNFNSTSQTGICELSENKTVIAWKFLQGEEGERYSFCATQGYNQSTVQGEKCSELGVNKCAACELPNGSLIEVTKAMDLNTTTGRCGDGICSTGENYKSCKKDCPSGKRDGYCDKVEDGKCDPDCELQGKPEADPDCSYCGDGICSSSESHQTCQADCPIDNSKEKTGLIEKILEALSQLL